MPGRLLPLFPLELVLLPFTRVPLHIFEERYKEMIGVCLAANAPFGIVLARSEGLLRTGCAAIIDTVTKRYDDGRLDILVSGRQRFQIVELVTEQSFLEAEVDFFDDLEATEPSPQAVARALASHIELLQISESREKPPDLNSPGLSFRLASVSNDLDFRQTLLDMRNEAERMERVASHLATLLHRRKTRSAMHRISRSNGQGHHL